MHACRPLVTAPPNAPPGAPDSGEMLGSSSPLSMLLRMEDVVDDAEGLSTCAAIVLDASRTQQGAAATRALPRAVTRSRR